MTALPAALDDRGSAKRAVPLRYALLPAAFVVLALVAPLLSDYALEIGFRLLLFVTLAEAWNLLAGYGGLVSLGTASFVGLGAYTLTATMNQLGLPWPAAVLAGAVAAALLALVVSPAVFRLRGLYFTVGTLALAEALRLLMINVAAFGGATGLFLAADPPPQRTLFFAAIALLGITTAAMELATRSRFSILLRAVRDDEDAAAQIGVRPFRIKLLAFVFASALIGAGGALQGLKLGAVEPYGSFGLAWTVDVLSIVIIGGQGRRAGALVGAVFVVALGELLADWPALHLALTGAIVIAVIRFAPQGLVGLALRLRQALRDKP